MPDLKISQLPPASTPLAGTELVPIVQGGVTEQTTVQAILTGTVPSGTANGVLYLNGSKVVTSGSGLTFDGTTLVGTVSDAGTALKLAGATGKVRVRPYVDSTFGVVFDSTNAAESAYLPMTFYGTNIYTNPDTAAIWRISGSEQMRLTSTGLGIGTSSPAVALHLGAGRSFQVGSATDYVRLTQPNTNLFGFLLGPLGDYGLYMDSLRGNLGLGVAPAAWFGGYRAIQVGTFGALYSFSTNSGLMTNAYDDGVFKYSGTGFAQRYFHSTTNGSHAWLIAPSGTAGNAISFTQAMTLDAAGNLGIGITNPTSTLTIQGQTEFRASDGSIYGYVNGTTGLNALQLVTYSGATIQFATSGTERVRVKSQGQLRYIPLAADPAGAENGDVYYNSTTNKLRVYAGGAWVDLH